VSQKEHAQFYPKPGWVEHNATEIWRNTQEVAGAALRMGGLWGADLAGIGITNQRETTVLWDRSTGLPLHNAIVWQDTRVHDLVAAYAADGLQETIRRKTARYVTAISVADFLPRRGHATYSR
jgi:glycerol kinase